jgi:uncharacterized protein
VRILVDIIHPANVHYFRNFIFNMKSKGHKLFITARDKDVTIDLLAAYGFDYHKMGTGTIGKGALGKLLYLIFAEFKMLLYCLKFKPEIVLSFGSTPVAHVSYLLRINHISFDDTEHAKLNRKLYLPFTPFVISPACFYEDLGKNHFRFKGYMELFYLHKDTFSFDKNNVKLDEINKSKPLILFRFVSWGAFHDIGEEGLSDEAKYRIVHEAKKKGNVIISSEGELPDKLKQLELKIEPEKFHDFLAIASLYIGEGGTTASECAMLGTPSIYINSLPLMGYLKDASDNQLLFHLEKENDILLKMNEIMGKNERDLFFEKKRNEMLADCINPTNMLIWIVENYPESKEILIKDPDFQKRFK